MKMEITYDPEVRAVYIYLRENELSAETLVLENGINVDKDANGNIIGIEVLGVDAEPKVKIL